MDEAGQELPKVTTESVQEKPKENVVNRVISKVRRALSGEPHNNQSETPEPPQLSTETLTQDLANLEDIRKRGGSDWNDPQSRARDDLRMEQLRAAIASRTPKPEVTEEPTIPAEKPVIQEPKEEPVAA